MMEEKDSVEEYKVAHSHDKARDFLGQNSEDGDPNAIGQMYEILDKVVHSTSSLDGNIIEAIKKIKAIPIQNNGENNLEKKLLVVGLLESFYDKCKLICEVEEKEELFVTALTCAYDENDQELQGFLEDMYSDFLA